MHKYGEQLLRQTLCLIALCLSGLSLAAADPVYRIGVLANRGPDAAVAEWSAHVDYLNRKLDPLKFELVPLSFHDLSAAAQQRRVQFVITNPGHYIEIAFSGSVNRIATRQMLGPAGPLASFGGVVIARAARADLNTYADLRGKSLLIPDRSSLGGWQVHVGEAMEEGIDLRTGTTSIKEVGTHDDVVFGILAGQADAGLVRTSLLESMAAEGRILLDDFRVVNLRRELDFPYRLSTRLYPEWPIARVEGTPEEVTRKLLIALLGMAPGDPAARAAGLNGWTVPLNYQPVNDLFYRTRQGPYEHLPITGRDVVERYGLHLAVAIGLIMLIIGLALATSITANRALRRARDGLAEREEQFRSLVTNIPGVVYRCAPDQDWTIYYVSEHIRDLSGYPASDFIERRRSYASIIHPDDMARVDQEVNAQVAAGLPFVLEYRIVDAGGGIRWILEHGRAHYGPDRAAQWLDGVFLDISTIKQAEVKLRQASAVFQHTAEGIIVTDVQRHILTVNPAFVGITGYKEAELIGHSPAVLRSGRHDAAFFAAMWREIEQRGSWQGEIWNRRKNGEVYPSWQTISALRDANDQVVGYISLYSDITSLKQSEERLQWLAYHDPLTGLANRVLFEERLRHAIRQALRHKEQLAVLYFDLDGFKTINDNLGHQVGDELLEALAQRLESRLRKSDTLSRRGGDEFTVLLENLNGTEEAVAMANEILRQMVKPFALPSGHQVNTSCSLGISLFPDDSENIEELIRCADIAMYRAKQDGGNCYRLFSPERN